QEAFEKALEFTCVEACQRHGTGRVPESRLGEACDRRRREVPRPIAHKACVDGFNAGFAATTAFMAERVELPLQVSEMEEEPKAALLERHAPILEEVAAELDLSGEFDTTEQAEQAQNVDVPNLAEVAQGVVAGNVGSTASMPGESGAGTPLRERHDKLEEDASSGKGDSATIKLGPKHLEVLKAENIEGFQSASRGRSISSPSKGDSNMIKLGPEYLEVLMAEHVEGFQGASSDKNIKTSGEGDSTTIELGPEHQEVLKAEHVKGFQSGDRNIESSGIGDATMIELGSEFQEVLKAERVQGFEGASRVKIIGNQAGEESVVPETADEKEKEAEGVSSKVNLVIELPKDGRFQEVLTADHVKAFHNPSSRDKPRSDHSRSGSAGGVSLSEAVPASRGAELEDLDFVTLGQPEPPLSTNEQTVEGAELEDLDFVTLGQPEPPLSTNEQTV
ncbi:unnamed protein product, partial [Laminaria digitata]